MPKKVKKTSIKKGGARQDAPSFDIFQKEGNHSMKMSYFAMLFKQYLENTKNASPKTVENYTFWIQNAVAYFRDPDVQDIKPLDILQYRMELSSRWLSKKTVNYYIMNLHNKHINPSKRFFLFYFKFRNS